MKEYPDDWKIEKLGENSVISRGGSPRPIQNWLTTNDNGVNWIKIGDVAPGARYILKTAEKIRPEGAGFSRRVTEGDLILSNSMSFGRPYVLKINGCIHDGWLAIQQYEQKYVTDFLYYILSSQEVMTQYLTMAAGSSVKNLNKEKVYDVTIPVPPLHEQKRIAEVLGNVDKLIENLEKRLAKKRAIKQGAMQELLTGKKRLPGFTDDWKHCEFGEIGKLIGGGTPSTQIASYWNGAINWFTPAEVDEKKKYVCNSLRKITEVGLANSAAKLLPSGTILLTTRATIGLTAILTSPATTNQGFQSVVVGADNDREFVYYLINTLKNEMVSRASGSTFLEISSKKLKSIPVVLPSLPEQRAIAKVLSDMDDEISVLERKLEKVKQVKQGMMQDLLTGKVRLRGQA